MTAHPDKPLVHVVDDDEAVRESLSLLLMSAGFSCSLFVSALDFLERYKDEGPGCLVLDLQMPGMDGLELQERLVAMGIDLPIIFLTGHGDVPAAVSALRAGAVNFMEKPFDPDVLLDTLTLAVRDHSDRIESNNRHSETRKRLNTLTPREREIFDSILEGKASKVIAFELDISERTVELHRSRILKKLEVPNVTSLMSLFLSNPEAF
jgi:two-component system response regulator FixJ